MSNYNISIPDGWDLLSNEAVLQAGDYYWHTRLYHWIPVRPQSNTGQIQIRQGQTVLEARRARQTERMTYLAAIRPGYMYDAPSRYGVAVRWLNKPNDLPIGWGLVDDLDTIKAGYLYRPDPDTSWLLISDRQVTNGYIFNNTVGGFKTQPSTFFGAKFIEPKYNSAPSAELILADLIDHMPLPRSIGNGQSYYESVTSREEIQQPTGVVDVESLRASALATLAMLDKYTIPNKKPGLKVNGRLIRKITC